MVAIAALIASSASERMLPGVTAAGADRSVGRRGADLLHRLCLFAGGPASCARVPRAAPESAGAGKRARAKNRVRDTVKLLYFAWVRQKIGASEEELRAARFGHHGVAADRFLAPRGPGYEAAFRDLKAAARRGQSAAFRTSMRASARMTKSRSFRR